MSGPIPQPGVSDKAGVVEDFIDIFYQPATVYERRRNSSAWIPLIAVTLVVGLGYLASSGQLQPVMDAEVTRAVQGNPGMSPEMIEQQRSFAAIGATVSVFVGTPIAIAFAGLVLLLTSKLVDATQTAGASVLIAAWAYVPRMVQAVLLPIQLRFLDVASLDGMYRLSAGPARVLDPDTTAPLVLALAGRFDLFIIWSTALMAIGLSVIARIPRGSAWVAAALVWLLGAVPTVFSAVGR
ncbi:MAG TPA: YIP1 family protein [Gemmatimonadaceae bacterium]